MLVHGLLLADFLLATTIYPVQEGRLVELVLSSEIGAMVLLSLPSRVHEVVDPVVLEAELVRTETLWLRDDLDLLVVVRSASIRGNDSPLEVRVHEVRAAIVLDGLLLLSFGHPLTLGDGSAVELLKGRLLDWRRVALSSTQCSVE